MSETTQVTRPILDLVERLRRQGEPIKAVKFHGNAFTEAGTPDVLGCYRGRMFAVECKLPGEKPTKLQKKRLEQWAAAGAITGVACSVEEFLEILGVASQSEVVQDCRTTSVE